jgi:hypothetical protein
MQVQLAITLFTARYSSTQLETRDMRHDALSAVRCQTAATVRGGKLKEM